MNIDELLKLEGDCIFTYRMNVNEVNSLNNCLKYYIRNNRTFIRNLMLVAIRTYNINRG